MCSLCRANPVKVAETVNGDLCWFCYYRLCFFDEFKDSRYKLRFGKNGVKDEKEN